MFRRQRNISEANTYKGGTQVESMIYRLDNKGCCETTCIKNDPPLGLYFSIGLSAYISILVKPNYNIMDVERDR